MHEWNGVFCVGLYTWQQLELLVPALETMTLEAASLGLQLNWQKTKVQALGSSRDAQNGSFTIRIIINYPDNYPDEYGVVSG